MSSLSSQSQTDGSFLSDAMDSSVATIRPEPVQDLFGYGFGVDDDHPQLSEALPDFLPEVEEHADPTEVPQLSLDVQSSLGVQSALSRNMLGAPSSMNFLLPALSCGSELSQILRVLIDVEYGITRSDEDIRQAEQGARSLARRLASMRSSDHPVTPAGSNQTHREQFQCRICYIEKFQAVTLHGTGTLKRHLATQHRITDKVFDCPFQNCPKSPFERRDKLSSHLNTFHRRADPALMDNVDRSVDLPAVCPICRIGIIAWSWNRVFQHIKHHCLTSPGTASTTTGDDRSRRGGNGGGNDGGSNSGSGPHYPSFAGPSNGNGQSWPYPSSQASDPQRPSYLGTQGGYMNNYKKDVRPNTQGRSVSDTQLDPRGRLGWNDAAIDDLMNTSLDSNLDMTDGSGPQLYDPQSAQAFWGSEAGQPGSKAPEPSKGKGPASQRAPTKQPLEQQSPKSKVCKTCKHNCGTCRYCQDLPEPIHTCHECAQSPQSTRIATQTIRPSGSLFQAGQTVLRTTATQGSQNIQRNFPEDYVGFPQGSNEQQLYTPSNYATQHARWANQDGSFNNATDAHPREIFRGNPFVQVAMIAEDHSVLQSADVKSLRSSKLVEDFRLLHNLGLSSFTRFKSFDDQYKQAVAKASLDLVTESHRPVSTNGGLPALGSSQSASQCQCPCMTLPHETYSAKIYAKLSPSERVEMSFDMKPASRQSSHPLRTRVRVLVKLLKLRASVSKPSPLPKQCQSIKLEDSSEEAESDTDLDRALSPSSSGSEFAPAAQTADVQDWSFEFELYWAIEKFSEWTSGLSADTYREHFKPYPGRIMDMVSMYILHQCTLLWTLAGSDGISLLVGYLRIQS